MSYIWRFFDRVKKGMEEIPEKETLLPTAKVVGKA